jgi:hypothetical protein
MHARCLAFWLCVWMAAGVVLEARAQDSGGPMTGPVLETMNAGRYTYVRIKSGDRDVWAAGPKVAVAVGETVTIAGGLPMEKFESPSLHRTFDSILFVNEIQVPGKSAASAQGKPGGSATGEPQAAASATGLPPGHPALPEGHPAVGGSPEPGALPPGHPPLSSKATAKGPEVAEAMNVKGTVLQTMDAGLYTYIEVKADSGNRWLAAPQVAVKVGDKIRFPEGMEMKAFESRTLKRKFDSIFFVSGIAPAE